MQHNISSFPPIEPYKHKTRILILGSIPGEESLRQQQYYAHPRNAFWWIISQILNTDLTHSTYQQKIDLITKNGIALWDTLKYCQRKGSLDSNIKNESAIINDIATFLQHHKQIKLIACNGQKSAQLFKRYVLANLHTEHEFITLPSTSPAHASMRREEKLKIWREALAPYL